jgi:deoxyuridine 5'-triphosphate nucleotidohydrolase
MRFDDMCKPVYKTRKSAGADIVSRIPIFLEPGQSGKFPTGVHMDGSELVSGHFELRIRSSLAKKFVALTNGVGTIDADYNGEICVMLANFGDTTLSLPAYTRVAQILWIPVHNYPEFAQEETERNGGFGSTNTESSTDAVLANGKTVSVSSSAVKSYEFPDLATPTTGGALKYDSSKTDFSLLPLAALESEARSLMYGEKKYGRDNWRKGTESHRLIAAAMRHLHAYNEGEDNDPESGVSHLGHARACLGMLLGTIAAGTVKDTRPARLPHKENKT